jgi:hypothetical protein
MTGKTTDLGTNNLAVAGAATNPAGTLYGLDQSNSALLFKVSPPSPTATPIGNVGFLVDGLVAFDPKGNLYTTNATANNDILYKIDPTSGASTPIGTGTGFGSLFAGAFVGSTLYGFTPSNQIIAIDASTGAGTLAGTYSLPNGDAVFAAASRLSPVPEASSLILAVSGAMPVVAASVLRRLRRPEA